MSNNKIYATLILFFISVSVFVYFVFPQIQNYNKLKGDIAAKKSKIEQKQLYVANLHKLTYKVNTRHEALEKVNTAMPFTVDYASIINFLGKKADENGLVLKSYNKEQAAGKEKRSEVLSKEKNREETPEEKKEKEIFKKVKKNYFSISLTGDINSFENFILSLEKSSRLFEIKNISIKKGEKGLFDFSVVLYVYSYSPLRAINNKLYGEK